MQFDLNQFLRKSTEDAKREFSLDCSAESFDGFSVNTPCRVEFFARHKGERAELEIRVQAVLEAECARCLTEIAPSFTFCQQYLVSMDELQSDDCELPVQGRGMLDLDELARTEIWLQAPQVLLCSEDCQGLCPVCGAPRKLGCGCEERQTDERLSIFDQLLS